MNTNENAARSPQSAQSQESTESKAPEGLSLAAPAFQLSASAADAGGLPRSLRAGVEQLSGFDLSAVRVIRGSSLPAKYGAFAFAKGMEIHLAPGHEDKLAHEVWHLIQQWRGLVKATHIVDGQAVNKDPRLEEDADRMGAQAESIHTPTSDRQALRQPAPQDVLQRLAVQISLEKEEKIVEEIDENNKIQLDLMQEDKKAKPNYLISQVAIVGRPEKAFSNSMGDHTTAFSVHQKGLQVALKNRTVKEAADHISKLFSDLKYLPGMQKEVIDRIPSKGDNISKGDNMKKVENEMATHYDGLVKAYNDGSPLATLHLQRLIAGYLEYREQVPFSVMNIASVSFALAGKGKGEAKHSSLLESHESGNKKVESVAIQQAILNLLDTDGLAILCAESESDSREAVLPGIAKDAKPMDIMKLVIKQHLMSIQMAFPKCYKDAGIGNLDEVIQNIAKIIAPTLRSRIEQQVGFLQRQRDKYQRFNSDYEFNIEYNKSKKYSENKFKRDGKHTQTHLDNEKERQDLVETGNHYGDCLKYITDLQQEDWIKNAKNTDKTWESDEQNTKNLGDEAIQNEGDKLNDREEDILFEEEINQTIATELVLNNEGRVIDFLSGGRTKSPFGSQYMGAHTTAWVVHLDEIRRTIYGLMPDDAILALHDLADEHWKHCLTMEDLVWIEVEHKQLLYKSKDDLTEFYEQEEVDDFEQITFLQSYINALLTFINFIPGATINKANTNGHGEGASRRYLLDFEAGKETSLKSATKHAFNLLDIDDLDEDVYSPDAIKEISDHHMKTIKTTYPRFGKAYDKENTKSNKKAKVAL